MLRRLPRILRFIPGTAQDVRVYFLAMQYWLAGSEENIRNLVALLVSRYAAGPREVLRELLKAEPPAEYPEVGLYHPRCGLRLFDNPSELPAAPKDCLRHGGPAADALLRPGRQRQTLRCGDRGAGRARPARYPGLCAGLDARPAVDAFFLDNGAPVIDALVSLTGFSLVGGPAYNDAQAAEEMLAELDVPYVAAHATEFQTLEQWAESDMACCRWKPP